MTARGTRLAAVLLAGAGFVASAPVASAAPVPLAGTRWALESSGFARTAPVKYTGSPAHVSIDGKRGGGNDGCNVFGMNADVKGDHATFSGLFSTLRMCDVPDAGEQFRRAFDGARTVRVTGDRLTISDGPRGYWNFVAAGPAKR
ncbi:META domain-containing protein [Tsukamurella ocularis]|uniref:META domain-containing protein n=1 Tax=Tsukamurella ocularis TaxID=1970234 RepID=UPI002167E677|nr:META domain-containing protein [Tsukamurella ocularis]MCS3781677.1 heat shock protein HslJ [Tsukamurella ocularis]MCS3788171.1 heat shock protein HslJ [Tsukamurella ocularis]MCS3851891.1 heat shock protein HslJ [Tsukamurella ocularis]